jgi:hypothetical protein
MPVEIYDHFYLFLLMRVHDLILDEVNLGIKLLGRIFPSSIEVSADERASIIAMDDSIRIYHGKQLKDKRVSQGYSFRGIRN